MCVSLGVGKEFFEKITCKLRSAGWELYMSTPFCVEGKTHRKAGNIWGCMKSSEELSW